MAGNLPAHRVLPWRQAATLRQSCLAGGTSGHLPPARDTGQGGAAYVV